MTKNTLDTVVIVCIGRIGGNCGKRSIKIYKLDASVLCYWQVFLVLESFDLSVVSKYCLMYCFQFTLACIKMGRLELAQKAVALAEKRLPLDRWPEYYDTRTGKFIGKQARLYQTWTIAGFLASKMLLENPEMASLLFWEEDYELLEICVCALSKSGRKKCSRFAAKSQILV